jgi:hypothetical protein
MQSKLYSPAHFYVQPVIVEDSTEIPKEHTKKKEKPKKHKRVVE